MKSYIKSYEPLLIFPLKYCRVYSKYTYNLKMNIIDNIINTDINDDINIIKNLTDDNKIPIYDMILKYAINGDINNVKKLLELKNNKGVAIFDLSIELFNGACSGGNIELIKYLQRKGCVEDEYSILEIIGNGYSKNIIKWGLDNLRCKETDDLDILSSAIGSGNLDTVKYLMENGIDASISRTKSVHDIRIIDLQPLLATCELPLVLFKPIIIYLSKYKFKCNSSVLLNLIDNDEYTEKKNLMIKSFNIYT